MAKLVFTDVGMADSFKQKNGSFLVQAELSGSVPLAAVVFQCILNRDVDGAPRCYARFNPAHPTGKNGGLDYLANATSDEHAVFNAIGNHHGAGSVWYPELRNRRPPKASTSIAIMSST